MQMIDLIRVIVSDIPLVLLHHPAVPCDPPCSLASHTAQSGDVVLYSSCATVTVLLVCWCVSQVHGELRQGEAIADEHQVRCSSNYIQNTIQIYFC
jgi:hypothetical protein